MAKKIYHTTSEEDKNVYHTSSNCYEGKKIEEKDKITRKLCKVCAKDN